MAGKIICVLCFVLCALPFIGIAAFGKNSSEPISFWSGDTTLKQKVKDTKSYNREMAKLYYRYGFAILAAGITGIFSVITSVILTGMVFTIGLYIVFRKYKKILARYS